MTKDEEMLDEGGGANLRPPVTTGNRGDVVADAANAGQSSIGAGAVGTTMAPDVGGGRAPSAGTPDASGQTGQMRRTTVPGVALDVAAVESGGDSDMTGQLPGDAPVGNAPAETENS
jgi:hypothetical protein